MRPVRVTVVATGSCSPIILETKGRPQWSLNVDVVSGVVNYTVQITNDNLFDTSLTPTWFDSPDPDLVGSAVARQSSSATGPFAIKVVNAGSGTLAMTVISSGAMS